MQIIPATVCSRVKTFLFDDTSRISGNWKKSPLGKRVRRADLSRTKIYLGSFLERPRRPAHEAKRFAHTIIKAAEEAVT
jgi:hypothetical protein